MKQRVRDISFILEISYKSLSFPPLSSPSFSPFRSWNIAGKFTTRGKSRADTALPAWKRGGRPSRNTETGKNRAEGFGRESDIYVYTYKEKEREINTERGRKSEIASERREGGSCEMGWWAQEGGGFGGPLVRSFGPFRPVVLWRQSRRRRRATLGWRRDSLARARQYRVTRRSTRGTTTIGLRSLLSFFPSSSIYLSFPLSLCSFTLFLSLSLSLISLARLVVNVSSIAGPRAGDDRGLSLTVAGGGSYTGPFKTIHPRTRSLTRSRIRESTLLDW